jgi:hypothetical protein
MTIAHCPKCREQVTVPTGASSQATVRCPLCSDQYLLADALRSLPPTLEILHDPEASVADETLRSPVPAFGRVEPSIVTGGSPEEFAFEPVERAPAFKFEESSTVPAKRSPVTSRSRARRKQAGPFRLAIQTIGGGMMGLLIAQLILWWMPGNWDVSNRDPFGLAVKVARYAPFLVPASLRGDVTTVQTTPATEEPQLNSSPTTTPSPTEGTTGSDQQNKLDTQIPDFTFNANAPDDSGKSATRSNKSKSKTESAPKSEVNGLLGSSEPKSESSPPPKTTDPVDVPDLTLDPTAVPKAKEKQEEPTANSSARLRNAPEVKAEDITSRLADVVSADLAWDNAQNPSLEEKRELLTTLFDQLARLGESTSLVSPDQSDVAAALKPVDDKLKLLSEQPEKLVPLGRLAGFRLPNQNDQGMAIVGVVLSHRPTGKVFESQVRLNAKSDPVVTVISWTDLTDQLPTGTNVLLIGRMVSSPAKNVIGYEGDAESALLHGTHAVVKQP